MRSIFAVSCVALLFIGYSLFLPSPVRVELVDWAKQSDDEPTISIAFISDLHLTDSDLASGRLERLLEEVEGHLPQAILLGGDFSEGHRENSERIRSIAGLLGGSTEIPMFAVLGNHEIDKLEWSIELQRAGVTVLRNQVIWVSELALCLRGLGDMYSGDYRFVDFPDTCENSKKLSFLHDPAGAFHPSMRGYVLAGHTHCGQINPPIVGPIWVPSGAPREAWCGSYKSEQITLHVSSGVGTSLLPLRIFASPAWALVTI